MFEHENMIMPRQLVLIRHGEAQHHVKGLTGGWTDTPLTARGRRQAERIGQALISIRAETGAQFFSSDLLRAKETAEVISRHLAIAPAFRSELRELNNGIAKGKTIEEAKTLALPLTELTIDWTPYLEAESWKAMSVRVTGFLGEIARQSKGGPLLVVSHGNAMVAIVHWWLGLREEHWSRISFEFDCASITRLTVNEWGEKTISKLNDTSHLEGI
jgi:probable phosphoglycerate mutase